MCFPPLLAIILHLDHCDRFLFSEVLQVSIRTILIVAIARIVRASFHKITGITRVIHNNDPNDRSDYLETRLCEKGFDSSLRWSRYLCWANGNALFCKQTRNGVLNVNSCSHVMVSFTGFLYKGPCLEVVVVFRSFLSKGGWRCPDMVSCPKASSGIHFKVRAWKHLAWVLNYLDICLLLSEDLLLFLSYEVSFVMGPLDSDFRFRCLHFEYISLGFLASVFLIEKVAQIPLCDWI